jgi:hypothetical protein
LRKAGLTVMQQRGIDVTCEIVGEYSVDLPVDDAILIELKPQGSPMTFAEPSA